MIVLICLSMGKAQQNYYDTDFTLSHQSFVFTRETIQALWPFQYKIEIKEMNYTFCVTHFVKPKICRIFAA